MVKNKDKPWWKRLLAKITALVAAVCMMLLPATAHADMQGIDVSNWQCGIDTATVPADFVIVGTTWGSGGVYGGCLSNGVNTDANRQLAGAVNSGKETGVYHYARGGNPDLRPELATGLDLAWEQHLAQGGVFSVGAFERRIDDLIRSQVTLENTGDEALRWVSRPQNIGRARSRGLELEAKARAAELAALHRLPEDYIAALLAEPLAPEPADEPTGADA